MLTYRRLERAVWALFVAYVLAGVYQQLVMEPENRDRLFPLNSWALFAKVPSEITDYSVRVLELNGERMAAPYFVEEVGGQRSALASVQAYGLIQKLGRALGNDDRNSVARARRALEGIYLNGAEPFRYEVVRRTYDPVERWHGGALRTADTVGQFDSRGQP